MPIPGSPEKGRETSAGLLVVKQGGDTFALMDAADGFAEDGGDILRGDLWAVGHGGGVGADELFDGAGGEAFEGHFAEDGVGDACEDAFGAAFFKEAGGGGEGAGGFGHVVDEEDVAAFDFADDIDGLDLGGAAAVLGDNGEVCAEGFREGVGHFDAADVRGDDDEPAADEALLAEVAGEDWLGVEVVDGDVEEALDLSGVEVDGEDAVYACGGEEVGDEFGGDGDARLVFAVLAGVAEEGDDGGDPLSAGAPCGVDHDEQFHDVVIGGRAGGLDDEDIAAADVFVDFDEAFTVREGGDRSVGASYIEVGADAVRQDGVGSAAEDFHRRKHVVDLAGVVGGGNWKRAGGGNSGWRNGCGFRLPGGGCFLG